MKTFKTRHQFYLPDELSAKLDALAAKPGSSKTAVMTDALAAWIDRRAANELDQRFGARLDRQSRTEERIERKLETIAEMLGTFMQHQLTLVAHQPPFDEATGRLGLDRFRKVMDLVGRRLARPEGSLALVDRAKQESSRGK